jgi:hypothetical protein
LHIRDSLEPEKRPLGRSRTYIQYRMLMSCIKSKDNGCKWVLHLPMEEKDAAVLEAMHMKMMNGTPPVTGVDTHTYGHIKDTRIGWGEYIGYSRSGRGRQGGR